MSNLVEFAKNQLKELNKEEPGGVNKLMEDDILELMEVFSKQGHSGFSANYCIETFSRLAKFKPIVPLFGTDDEWAEPFDSEGTRQNKKLHSVFKEANGKCYDIDAVIFYDVSRCGEKIHFTNKKSRRYIKFPYFQKSQSKMRISAENIFNTLMNKVFG